MDLYFSLKNPFYSFKGRMLTYHAFVWLFALVDSLVPWLLDEANKVWAGRLASIAESENRRVRPSCPPHACATALRAAHS